MRVGGWWLSPGRRTFRPREMTVPWLWVERDPYSFKVVLWGGGPQDVQVGSRTDRIRTANLNRRAEQNRAMIRMQMAFVDNLTPALREASRAITRMAEGHRRLAQAMIEREGG